MSDILLDVQNLTGGTDTATGILKDFSLQIERGSVHAIMGPNGTGKSTLSYLLAGRDNYSVEKGTATFKGMDLLEMEAEERAQAGLFLAFQYPVEIPGVSNHNFLRQAINAHRQANGEDDYDAIEFVKLLRKAANDLGIEDKMLKRPVNTGFSGGEKKRNEILQMQLLQPDLAIMDETDSGLDIDAMKLVADGVNRMRGPERSFLMITHYQRLLDYIVPDYVHVMVGGRIVASGDKDLAKQLEKEGYAPFEAAA